MSTLNPVIRRLFIPLFILFIIINILCLLFTSWLIEKKVDTTVVIAANLLLFIIGVVNGAAGVKALKNPNPNVFVRGIMAGSFIKLMIIAAAVIIYLLVAKENRSVPAVIVGMGLYILYSIIEVKAAFTLNKKKDGGH